jgi:hypothetical protein
MKSLEVKVKKVLDRIASLELSLARAREYLDTGAHADWTRFRPLFVDKCNAERALPPHKDWVQSTFIPRRERALRQAERALERLEQAGDRSRANSSQQLAALRAAAE